MSSEDTTIPLLNKQTNSQRFQTLRWTPIEVLVVLYFIPAICITPIQQYYVVKVLADQHNISNFINQDNNCHNTSTAEAGLENDIEKESSEFLMYLGFCSTFLSVIPIAVLGAVADRLGRKSVMCFCLAGLLVKEIIYIIVIHFGLSLYILYLGQVVEGLTGGFGAMMMGLFGMAADITFPGKNRAFRISVVEGTAAITASISMFGVGYWIKYGGFYTPMIFICVVTILAGCFCVMFIPETSNCIRQNENFCSTSYLFKSFQLYCNKNPEGRRRKLTVSLFILALSGAAVLGRSNTVTLFLLNHPLCWNEVKVQVFNGLQTLLNWGAVIVVVRVLHIFTQDYGILIIGAFSATTSMLLLAFSTTDWLVYLYVVLGICSSSVFPMARAMMSRLCTTDEQGSLFASIASTELFFTAISQLTYGGVYKWSLSFFPGFVFLLMACVLFIVLVASIKLYRWMSIDNTQTWQVIN